MREYMKEQFAIAKENKNGICVELEMPNQDTTEKIINDWKALDVKLDYYLKAYDENGIHVMNNQIKIVDVYPCDWYTTHK